MKRILYLVVVLMFSSLVSSQTLADMARQARKNKPAPSPSKQVITNESLSMTKSADDSTSDSSAAAASADAKTSDKKDAAKDEKSSGGSDEDKKKLGEEWKAKIEKQIAEVAQLKRELDVMQRETKLAAAAYYADAGNRLRNEASFGEQERKSQADIAAKQAAITNAERTLSNMRDDARKAGVMPGMIP
jgi:hypothetical protein